VYRIPTHLETKHCSDPSPPCRIPCCSRLRARPPSPPLRAFGRRIIPYHTLPALTHRDYWGKGEGTWILQVPKPYAPPWPSTMAWSARMNARRASGPRDT